jgi:very-short-patch-repair endonuclease
MMERSREYYDIEYDQNKRSLHDIAEEWDTYPNKIRRELIKLGFRIRDKSEAQSEALRCGRHKHPTKGTERSEETKLKISSAISNIWTTLTEGQRESRISAGKAQWGGMSDASKSEFKQKGYEAVRKAIKEGSKLEIFLMESLENMGYTVEFHRDGLIPDERLQIDLFVPELKLAIEIDGPSHFDPIWGAINLQKNKEADNRKNDLLIKYGYTVIRVKNTAKTLSQNNQRNYMEQIVELIENLNSNLPTLLKVELTSG